MTKCYTKDFVNAYITQYDEGLIFGEGRMLRKDKYLNRNLLLCMCRTQNAVNINVKMCFVMYSVEVSFDSHYTTTCTRGWHTRHRKPANISIWMDDKTFRRTEYE